MTETLQSLSKSDYIRERINPRLGDPLYIVLSDLLQAVGQLCDRSASRVLDFGCGGMPYRPLFHHTYHGADLAGNPKRDITLTEDFRLPPGIHNYDLVLSTQVLEHVEDPLLYLSECYRALRPGGALVLTTHGLFEDHPCPTDYWRWTAAGLNKLVEQAGFVLDKTLNVTSRGRATLFFIQQDLGEFSSRSKKNVISICFRVVSRLGLIRLHQFADRYFGHCRVVVANSETHSRYVGLAVRAIRP